MALAPIAPAMAVSGLPCASLAPRECWARLRGRLARSGWGRIKRAMTLLRRRAWVDSEGYRGTPLRSWRQPDRHCRYPGEDRGARSRNFREKLFRSAKTARKTESRRLAPTAGLCKEKPRAEWGLDEGLIGALGLGARISAPNPQTPPAVGPPAAPGSLEDASSPAGLHQPKSLGGGLRQPNSRQFRVGAVALRGNHRILLTRSHGRS
jgi:hypothetical protein